MVNVCVNTEREPENREGMFEGLLVLALITVTGALPGIVAVTPGAGDLDGSSQVC